jgi:hypothetical protein
VSSHGDDSGDESREQHLPDTESGEGSGASEPEPPSPEDFDSAWRAIVAHYDDPVEPFPETSPSVDPLPESVQEEVREELPFATPGDDLDEVLDRPQLHQADPLPAWSPVEDPDEDVFVPPVTPPMPETPLPKRLAWIALLGAPAALLILTVIRWRPPELVTFALVAAFIGGFGYLVATMGNEPRDPWDDGSRV